MKIFKIAIVLLLLNLLFTSCTKSAVEVQPSTAEASGTQAVIQTQQPESSKTQNIQQQPSAVASSSQEIQSPQPVESNINHVYLTQEEFNRIKAPLNILALCAGTNDEYKFESSDQVTEDMLGTFGANLIVYFDLFKPELIEKQDGSFSGTFVNDYALYGIKKGELRVKNKSYYFPQKGLFEILNSTFGDLVMKRFHIDPAKLYEYPKKSINYKPIKYENGIYIFPFPNEYAYDTSTIETDMRFPVDITENNILTAKAEIAYMDDNNTEFNISFKVIKNEKSEWGYNITAFNMQEVK